MKTKLKVVIACVSFLILFVDRSQAATQPPGITRIILQRTACYGGLCPDYTITLTSKGCAHLNGNANFALIGHFSAQIYDFEDAARSVESHHFFDLKSVYPDLGKDQIIVGDSTATLSVTRNGITKTVVTYGGYPIPASLRELFQIIDGFALTAYWFNDATGEPVATKHTGATIVEVSPQPAPSEECP